MTVSHSPHELSVLLDRHPEIECLSLDCFDTLLWRDTHAPADVFYALPGVTVLQRGKAEQSARKAAKLAGRGNEVTIAEIYAKLMPGASHSARKAAIAAEIAAEARHCYAFAPVVALMREAKARGLRIVIVSDTYLDSAQLRELIAQAAGDDVAGLIDKVYCSCTFGHSKADGLYGHVLKKLKLAPDAVLHIGDNRKADVGGVEPFGIHTAHLGQFADATRQRLRLESAVDAMIHPSRAETAKAVMPHRPVLSLAEPQCEDPAERLGLGVLGPVLHGFERWLRREAEALEAEYGGTVHWLFLMRDGHLPLRVHDAVAGGAPSHAIEISRFTSIAASLRDDRAIANYVECELGMRPESLARQILLPEDRIHALLTGKSMQDASIALLNETRTASCRKAIASASRAFGDRLVTHVKATVQPKPGDTLMLVDLGYNGTVQNHIDGLLAERLGVHVAGRYLILREKDRPGLDKRGFIGTEDYDPHSLEAMCANVAVLEQLCTSASGSVIDYGDDGTPVRRANDIKGTQSEVRERIQAGCVAFQRHADDIVVRRAGEIEIDAWRRGAASTLARMMFLPLADELATLEHFEHDINMGTDRTTGLFDRAHAQRGLRQRGLFYMNGSQRMYLPAELEGQGLATRLSLFAHRRFGLPLTFADFADKKIDLPVVFAQANDAVQRSITATGTHDGFYLAAIPVGKGRYSIALRFGALFEWLELESLSFYPVDDFLSDKHEELRREYPACWHYDQIDQATSHLLRCTGEESFVMIDPPEHNGNQPLLLACVFRPISARRTAAPNAGAPDRVREEEFQA